MAELFKKVLEDRVTFKNEVVNAEVLFGSNVLTVNGNIEYLHTIVWNSDLPTEVYDILMKYTEPKPQFKKK